jgi:hypothetical protein
LSAEVGEARRPVPWAADVARVEEAAKEARRVGVLLNQAVAALHSTGEAPDELGTAVAEARRAARPRWLMRPIGSPKLTRTRLPDGRGQGGARQQPEGVDALSARSRR